MKTITVKRSKWCRGRQPNDVSALLTPAGTMCCLGFLCLQEGLSKQDIDRESMPSSVEVLREHTSRVGGLLAKLTREDDIYGLSDSTLATRMSVVNDDDSISDETREYTLCHLALANGFAFEFVD